MQGSSKTFPAGNQARTGLYTFALFVVLIGFYSGLLALWVTGSQSLYEAIIRFFGVGVWPWPFLDIQGVLSWGECHAKGYDIFTYNPCDSLWRPFNYSPILLDLPLQWLGVRNTNAVGVTIDVVFLASLSLVLMPRTASEFAIAFAVSISPATLFAVERANLDVLEFAMIAAAGFLPLATQSGRLVSYALYFVAGLLKLYPFVLLAMLVRERPRVFIGLSVLSAVLLGIYALTYWAYLWRLPGLMPAFRFYELWGMRVFAVGGGGIYLGLPYGFTVTVMLTMCVITAWLAIRWAADMRDALPAIDWNERRYHNLVAGSLVIVGCFVAASNITYREIFLLLLLPGLFRFKESILSLTLKKRFSRMIPVVVFLLWEPFFRLTIDWTLHQINPEHPERILWDMPSVLYFIGREFIWWWLIASLGSLLVLYFSEAATVRAAVSRLPLLNIAGATNLKSFAQD